MVSFRIAGLEAQAGVRVSKVCSSPHVFWWWGENSGHTNPCKVERTDEKSRGPPERVRSRSPDVSNSGWSAVSFLPSSVSGFQEFNQQVTVVSRAPTAGPGFCVSEQITVAAGESTQCLGVSESPGQDPGDRRGADGSRRLAWRWVCSGAATRTQPELGASEDSGGSSWESRNSGVAVFPGCRGGRAAEVSPVPRKCPTGSRWGPFKSSPAPGAPPLPPWGERGGWWWEPSPRGTGPTGWASGLEREWGDSCASLRT